MNNRVSVKKLLSILVALTMIFTLFVSVTQVVNAASVYYVATNGNDNYPGTLAQPWRTITKAANTMVAGDTVYIKAGTYYERVIPANSGTSGNFISYKRYGTDTVVIDGTGVPVYQLDGNGNPIENGLVHINYKSYIKFYGIKVTNSNYMAVKINGGSNVYIENCDIRNNASGAIIIHGGTGMYIRNNYLTLNQTLAGGISQRNETVSLINTDGFEISNNTLYNNAMESIDVKDGSRNGSIFGNDISAHISAGIYVDAWAGASSNINVYNNKVHDSNNGGARGIVLGVEDAGSLSNVTVYNNLVYNCAAIGIATHWFSSSNSSTMYNIKIINNTVYHNGTVDSWGGGIIQDFARATNVIIRNNIVDGNNNYSIKVTEGRTATVDYNLIHDFRSAAYETKGTNYQEADPLFVNPAGSDFHIQSASLAKDHGTSAYAPSTDFGGTSRPQGAGYDIGAYEYAGGGPTPTPTPTSGGNLALNKTVTASSTETPSFPGSYAVDGNTGTRWSSQFSDPQWIYVDLGANYNVNRVVLNWEAAYASAYQIQVSSNAINWTNVYSTTTGNGGIDNISFAKTSARYVRMYGTARATQYGYSLWEFEVYGNLAQNKAVLVSSTETPSLPGPYAVDGNTGTRWASLYSDPQWIRVDLGTNYNINRVILNWEAAYASAYQIQVSNNGTTWTNVYSTTTGNGGIDDISFGSTSARYVRMYGTTRATQYGYSLWEFEVYGP